MPHVPELAGGWLTLCGLLIPVVGPLSVAVVEKMGCVGCPGVPHQCLWAWAPLQSVTAAGRSCQLRLPERGLSTSLHCPCALRQTLGRHDLKVIWMKPQTGLLEGKRLPCPCAEEEGAASCLPVPDGKCSIAHRGMSWRCSLSQPAASTPSQSLALLQGSLSQNLEGRALSSLPLGDMQPPCNPGTHGVQRRGGASPLLARSSQRGENLPPTSTPT